MERFDVSEAERFAEMVGAAQAGAEVEITKDGSVVARVVAAGATGVPAMTPMQDFLSRLARLRQELPPELLGGDATSEIRAMRDEAW